MGLVNFQTSIDLFQISALSLICYFYKNLGIPALSSLFLVHLPIIVHLPAYHIKSEGSYLGFSIYYINNPLYVNKLLHRSNCFRVRPRGMADRTSRVHLKSTMLMVIHFI